MNNNTSENKILSEENWHLELEKFPNAEQLKLDLQELTLMDKSHLTTTEIEELFFRKAIVYPFSAQDFPPEPLNRFPIWRARANVHEQIEDIENPNAFSLPDSKFCTQNGRANLRGKSVFYCAHNGATALLEVKPQTGDILYLGRWEMFCHRVATIMYFLPVDIPDKNPWYAAAKRLFEHTFAANSHNGKHKADQLKIVTAFVADAFVQEMPPYQLTSWLADKALFAQKNIDMLVYPSIVRKGISCNMVIHPDFVRKYLKLKQVYKVSVSNCNEDTMTYHLLSVGETNNGRVMWREATDEDDAVLPGNGFMGASK